MTHIELVDKLKSASYSELGRELFLLASDFEAKEFLRYLISGNYFDELYEIVRTQYISGETLTVKTIDAEYFDMMLKLAKRLNLDEDELIQIVLAAIKAHNQSGIGKWKIEASKYLLKLAERDFESALKHLTDYDPLYLCYQPLILANTQKAALILADRLINQKGHNKKAIRKIFLKHKPDISAEIIAMYSNSSAKKREAIVRLLLIYKHNARVAEFLKNAQADNSKIVRQLIFKDSQRTTRKAAIKSNFADNFFINAMSEGILFSQEEFETKIIQDPQKNEIAETLFFSVYKNQALIDVVVLEKGQICTLENAPATLPQDAYIGVLHPIDIPTRYEFIKRLNITQKIPQLKRRIFFASDDEKISGLSKRLAGTIMSVKDLKTNLKKLPSKKLQKTSDGNINGVIIYLDGFAALQELSSTDLSQLQQAITLKDLKLYRLNNVISIGGQHFFENAPKCLASEMPQRIFSEFLHAAYTLAGIINTAN